MGLPRGKHFWILGAGFFQLVVLLLCCQQTTLAAPDGINFYKDMLRGKNDEDEYAAMLSEEDFGGPKLFFYRTPMNSLVDMSSDGYEKRTVNKYKNMMLNKDALETLIEEREQGKETARFFFPRVTSPKRSPGAILSWAIPAANRVRVINTNYRPPGMNRPAA